MAKALTTTTYTWPNDSLVRRIDVREQSDGRAVAYLYADESEAARPQRQALRGVLRQKGWGTLSDYRDGAYALRISGFSKASEILTTLESANLVGSDPQITTSEPEHPKPNGVLDYIRSNSLTISGRIATVGNAMSIASGFHRGKEIGQIGQGAAFALADLPLAIAGERDDSRQQTNLLRQLKTHYEKSGVEIPKNAAIYAETSDKNRTVGQLAKDYLHRYANQIKCSLEVVAAGFTIHAGRNQKSSWKKYAPFIWGPGFAASLLIPERKIDAEKYAHAGTMERAWMNIQSNPLAIGGLLGYSNTIASYGSAINERRASNTAEGNGRKLYRWDFAIPTVMIGANGTYAISKKNGGDIKTDAMVNDVYIVAAQILNKQPESLREAAIESTAKFLGERPEIKDTHAEVVTKLREQMSVQRNSPWFEKTPLPAYTPQPKKPKLSVGREALSAESDVSLSTTAPVAQIHTQGLQHAGTAVAASAELTRAAAL